MSDPTEYLVQQVHQSGARLVLAVAGGGTRAIAHLLEVPGGSRSVLEACVPYSQAALVAWLGGQPDQFCSEPTARALAMAAYLRACRFDPSASKLAGVACTASLATERPKRGPHRAHLALQTATMTLSQSLQLQKGRRSRTEEEQIVAGLLLNTVAEACGMNQRLEIPLAGHEQVERAEILAPQGWQDLLAGRVDSVCCGAAGGTTSTRRAVFPGAFNPIHAGHRHMAQIAQERLGLPVEFEISIFNVDKPPLDFLELRRRTGQFGPQETVWLTRAATFEEKSRQFPGATFLVGADTLCRIADPRYYGSDPSACRRAIERIAGRGCRFLVFARRQAGRLVALADLELPPELRPLCEPVPPEVFCEEISSTEIRRSADL
ncbi:MAG: hypothetical protein ACUVUC_09665 [Thermoguttaceae bacterium]